MVFSRMTKIPLPPSCEEGVRRLPAGRLHPSMMAPVASLLATTVLQISGTDVPGIPAARATRSKAER